MLNTGPLPAPDVLAAYDQIVPGTAKRLIDEYFTRQEVSLKCLSRLIEYREIKVKEEKDYKLTVINLEEKYRDKLLKYNIGILIGLVILVVAAIIFKQNTIAIGLVGVIAVESIRAAIRPPMLL